MYDYNSFFKQPRETCDQCKALVPKTELRPCSDCGKKLCLSCWSRSYRIGLPTTIGLCADCAKKRIREYDEGKAREQGERDGLFRGIDHPKYTPPCIELTPPISNQHLSPPTPSKLSAPTQLSLEELVKTLLILIGLLVVIVIVTGYTIERILLVLAAFFIAWNFSTFGLMKILTPVVPTDAEESQILSLAAGFFLSALFAVWLLKTGAGDALIDTITSGYLRLFTAVISSLLSLIGLFALIRRAG